MPYTKILIHAVWATKNRRPCLGREFRPMLFQHIKENAQKKDIYLDCINGYLDHVHCIIGPKASQSVSEVINLLKGESSFWVNKNKLLDSKLYWQKDYYAESFNIKDLDQVRNYVDNQEEHHKKITYEEEYADFLKKAGFSEWEKKDDDKKNKNGDQ